MNLLLKLSLHLLAGLTLAYFVHYIFHFQIPGDLRGWLMVSLISPIISTLLSTSTWLSTIERTLIHSHTWDQDVNGNEIIEWLTIYMMKHKVWSYQNLTKVIYNNKSIWWNDSDWKTRPQIFELPSGYIIFKYEEHYLIGSYPYPSVQHLDHRKQISHEITIHSFKKVDWKKFVEDVRDYYYDHLEGGKMSLYKVNNNYYGNEGRQVIPIRDRPSREVCFGDSNKEKVWDLVIQFLEPETRDHFRSLSQPYKTSFLIYGPPGTGKTEMLFQLASYTWKDHRKPIYIINPRDMDDCDLEDTIEEIQSGYILVNEWDLVIKENKKKKSKEDKNDNDDNNDDEENNVRYPTVKAWLDILDQAQGEIVFWFTTNNYDRLSQINDGALIRDCRIDHRIEFKPMEPNHARKALKYFTTDLEDEIDQIDSQQLHNLTIAQIITHLKYRNPVHLIGKDGIKTIQNYIETPGTIS